MGRGDSRHGHIYCHTVATPMPPRTVTLSRQCHRDVGHTPRAVVVWAVGSRRSNQIRTKPKHSSALYTTYSFKSHGLGSEADRYKIVSRSHLICMFCGSDFGPIPALLILQ